MEHSNNVKTVIELLKDEIKGNVESALEKMSQDYSMTWMYQSKEGKLFPHTGKDVKNELEEVYPIKGRQYKIKNIAEGENVVIIELIESYPDPKDKEKTFRTPLVLVLEMEKGRVKTGRHYTDPRLSHLGLTEEKIEEAYRGKNYKDVLN